MNKKKIGIIGMNIGASTIAERLIKENNNIALVDISNSESTPPHKQKKHKHCYKPVSEPPFNGGIIKHKWVCDCGAEC